MSTVLLAVITIFEMFLLLITSSELLETFIEKMYGTKTSRVFRGSFYGAVVVSGLISFMVMLHFMKVHRDHVLQLCRGQRGFMQSVCLSPTSSVKASLSFTGFQIAYALWGFIVWSCLFFCLFFVPAILVAYKDSIFVKPVLGKVSSAAKASIPSAVFSVLCGVFQSIFLFRWTFRDRDFPDFTVTIDNRRMFSIISYVFVFLNVIVGLFSCLLRLIKGMILGLLYLPRLDRSCLMQGFQKWDKGFVAYLGFVTVLVAHRHPVMLVFCQLLIDRNKSQQADKETESQHPSHVKETKGSAETVYRREIRYARLSQKAVNRWLLAVTLLRNPSLIQHRRQWNSNPIGMSAADTSSITVLVQ